MPIYVRITDGAGVAPGEIVRNGLKNWFECVSWSHQEVLPGRGVGHARQTQTVKDVTFVKLTDAATPFLYLLAATGKLVDLDMEQTTPSAGGGHVYLKMTMKRALVSGLRYGGSYDGSPTELVRFSSSQMNTVYLGGTPT